MAADDNEQDLVTIRIPRRAAAMYAAQLDVSSSPGMVTLGVYGQLTAAVVATLLGIGLLAASISNCFSQTFDSAAIFGGVGLGFTLGGLFFTAATLRYRRELTKRAVM